MKLSHVLFALLVLSPTAHSMSDEEYVQAVGKEVRIGAFNQSVVYGSSTAYVHITATGAVLKPASHNSEFNAEILRAANIVLDSTVAAGLTFPVTYQGPRAISTDMLDRKFSIGGDVE